MKLNRIVVEAVIARKIICIKNSKINRRLTQLRTRQMRNSIIQSDLTISISNNNNILLESLAYLPYITRNPLFPPPTTATQIPTSTIQAQLLAFLNWMAILLLSNLAEDLTIHLTLITTPIDQTCQPLLVRDLSLTR